MSDWTAGYVADIEYTYGYYKELNPLRVRLAFLQNGLVYPEAGTACELGFGQGLSTNIHAAGSITEWHGTDFNPTQAGFAQELAAVSGANAHLFDEAFDQFAMRDDLPDFDYIGLHGIWSWISDQNRAEIVEFIRRKLKVGGVLYVSYNTLPGWAHFAPMRHLMTQHADIIGAEGTGIVSRIDDAIDFAERMLATNPMYSRVNPSVTDRMKKVKEHNRHYLAHEYFNKDWHPMHFATMVEWMEAAKVTYACSAHFHDYIDGINFTAEQSEFIKSVPDDMFRESVRDFIVNQQFRRDYWVKGPRRIPPLEVSEKLREIPIILVSHRPDITMKVAGSLGEADMAETVYGPVLDCLADHEIKTIAQLEEAVKGAGVKFGQLLEAITILAGSDHIQLVQSDDIAVQTKSRTSKLNKYICNKARFTNDIHYMASPVTGGGIPVTRFQQLFLLSYWSDNEQPGDWANFAWHTLSLQGQKLLKDGKILESDEENISELKSQALAFAKTALPILKTIGIA